MISDAYDTYASGALDPAKPPSTRPLDGSPDWAINTRYTIDARTDKPVTGAMMRGPMMQRLLEERFHVKVHRETREVAAWLMTVAKGGSKLRATTDESCVPIDPTEFSFAGKDLGGKMPCRVLHARRQGPLTILDFRGVTLDMFVRNMNPLDGKPFVNRTGLTGAFDIHLEWETDADNPHPSADGSAAEPGTHAAFWTAMREQLGLQLAPGRAMHDWLVLDHIERPTGN